VQYYDERNWTIIKINKKNIIYVDRQLLIEIYFPICVMLVYFNLFTTNTLLRLINIFNDYYMKFKKKKMKKIIQKMDKVKELIFLKCVKK